MPVADIPESTKSACDALSFHEQMLDAQSQCVPCKLCGGSAVINDAGVGAGYYIRCENARSFRKSGGCMIKENRLGGWAYNVMDAWNRLHAVAAPPAMDREAVETLVQPWADYHGDLPDYDHPLRPVYESGIQYAVELLAKKLGVTDWTPCDGTEEFDGDLGGTLMNIVLEAMPKDKDGDPIHPRDLLSTVSADASRQGKGGAFTGVEAWDELVNVDDRTSPEEYPDMCLITRDELIDFMERATLAANSSDDAGGDFACRFGGVEYSRSDLAIAQRAACAIVPLYGTGDHGEQDAARNGKLWNDHPAVQGALRALHVARLAATPKIMATSAELAALDAIDRFVTDHVGNDDTCDGIEVDERAQKAVEMLRAMFATPASHASDGGEA